MRDRRIHKIKQRKVKKTQKQDSARRFLRNAVDHKRTELAPSVHTFVISQLQHRAEFAMRS